MGFYTLRLDSGDEFYYDDIYEARFDKMQFGGVIIDPTGKEIT